MEKLSYYQLTLLENLLAQNEVLRHGHSKPVKLLIDLGFVVEVDGLYVASKKVTKGKIDKAWKAKKLAEEKAELEPEKEEADEE